MTRALLAFLLIASSIYAANAFGVGREGLMIGRLGSSPKKGGTNFRITNTGSFRTTDASSSRIISP